MPTAQRWKRRPPLSRRFYDFVVTGTPRLLIATTNTGKFNELSSLLSDCPFSMVSLEDLGIDEDVAETGSTFEENASLKAAAYGRMSCLPTLADDSGLEVEALGGEPVADRARHRCRIDRCRGHRDSIRQERGSKRRVHRGPPDRCVRTNR